MSVLGISWSWRTEKVTLTSVSRFGVPGVPLRAGVLLLAGVDAMMAGKARRGAGPPHADAGAPPRGAPAPTEAAPACGCLLVPPPSCARPPPAQLRRCGAKQRQRASFEFSNRAWKTTTRDPTWPVRKDSMTLLTSLEKPKKESLAVLNCTPVGRSRIKRFFRANKKAEDSKPRSSFFHSEVQRAFNTRRYLRLEPLPPLLHSPRCVKYSRS